VRAVGEESTRALEEHSIRIWIAAVYVSTELQGLFPKGSALRETMATWHSMLGLSVWLILDSRVVIGQFWRNSLFLQAFPGGLDRYGIFGKSHLI
jgi:hypothetical protein